MRRGKIPEAVLQNKRDSRAFRGVQPALLGEMEVDCEAEFEDVGKGKQRSFGPRGQDCVW
jgi:hypothetical protein